MMHYERIRADLAQAERTIKTALRAEVDSEAEKAALKEALDLMQQAEKKCQMVQKESMQTFFFAGYENVKNHISQPEGRII